MRQGHAVAAAEANRSFSYLLRKVRAGHSFIVTSHGRPVAKLVPIDAVVDGPPAARAALFARLQAAPARHVKRWTRDELYER